MMCNRLTTGLLQNAKVMGVRNRVRQLKRCNVHGKESIEEQFISSNLAVVVALVLLFFI